MFNLLFLPHGAVKIRGLPALHNLFDIKKYLFGKFITIAEKPRILLLKFVDCRCLHKFFHIKNVLYV